MSFGIPAAAGAAGGAFTFLLAPTPGARNSAAKPAGPFIFRWAVLWVGTWQMPASTPGSSRMIQRGTRGHEGVMREGGRRRLAPSFSGRLRFWHFWGSCREDWGMNSRKGRKGSRKRDSEREAHTERQRGREGERNREMERGQRGGGRRGSEYQRGRAAPPYSTLSCTSHMRPWNPLRARPQRQARP